MSQNVALLQAALLYPAVIVATPHLFGHPRRLSYGLLAFIAVAAPAVIFLLGVTMFTDSLQAIKALAFQWTMLLGATWGARARRAEWLKVGKGEGDPSPAAWIFLTVGTLLGFLAAVWLGDRVV